MKSRKRLGLLHSDGTLTVYVPDIGIDQARREAIDCDENQTDPDNLTHLVLLHVTGIEILDTPSKPLHRGTS
jgi:hypothetical protein